jgi:hypothetical protein
MPMRTSNPALVVLLTAIIDAFATTAEGRTYSCDSVVFLAELYADDGVVVDVQGDEIKKRCDFIITDDDALQKVSCDVVDIIAEVHTPKDAIVEHSRVDVERFASFLSMAPAILQRPRRTFCAKARRLSMLAFKPRKPT